MDSYQKFIGMSRYARYIPEEKRRETWEGTASRYVDYFKDRSDEPEKFPSKELYQAISQLKSMPSMRCLMTAGLALDRDNVAGFNCSYLTIDHVRAFDELMYILMCGTGVGFSAERQYINKLPEVAETLHITDSIIVVADSKIGWASSFRELIAMLYAGKIPSWDTSKVRKAGEPLKTFGGRASGPEPLIDLFKFSVDLFKKSAGRKLTSLECHDLVCKIADIVVVGGVRRSALISLSNPSDDRLRTAKSGQWWIDNPQRALANNSACYTEKPDLHVFMQEAISLYESKSGERGFFSRTAAKKQALKNGRREVDYDFGTNPCSEIILRPQQFCNLSECVVRAEDTFDDLVEKVRIATILGTLQSTLTDFRYLRKIWKKNTEEECLLGVSLTGIMDHPVLSGTITDKNFAPIKHCTLAKVLELLREVAVETNKEWAEKLGVNQSTAVTCVKPSGTVSQLVNSASGIHTRFSPYYIRRVRCDVKDPLAIWMQDKGFPWETDVMNPSNIVFSFPVKAPEGAICTANVDAKAQLDLWKIYQDHWCEHKPSITVYYDDSEFMGVMDWLYTNFDDVSGVSFLPRSEHSYQQAPYEEISVDTYNELLEAMPDDSLWENIDLVEETDNVEGTQTLACSGPSCEL